MSSKKGEEEPIPELLRKLQDPDKKVRKQAIEALEKSGKRLQEDCRVPAIRSLLDACADNDLFGFACTALYWLGRDLDIVGAIPRSQWPDVLKQVLDLAAMGHFLYHQWHSWIKATDNWSAVEYASLLPAFSALWSTDDGLAIILEMTRSPALKKGAVEALGTVKKDVQEAQNKAIVDRLIELIGDNDVSAAAAKILALRADAIPPDLRGMAVDKLMEQSGRALAELGGRVIRERDIDDAITAGREAAHNLRRLGCTIPPDRRHAVIDRLLALYRSTVELKPWEEDDEHIYTQVWNEFEPSALYGLSDLIPGDQLNNVVGTLLGFSEEENEDLRIVATIDLGDLLNHQKVSGEKVDAVMAMLKRQIARYDPYSKAGYYASNALQLYERMTLKKKHS